MNIRSVPHVRWDDKYPSQRFRRTNESLDSAFDKTNRSSDSIFHALDSAAECEQCWEGRRGICARLRYSFRVIGSGERLATPKIRLRYAGLRSSRANHNWLIDIQEHNNRNAHKGCSGNSHSAIRSTHFDSWPCCAMQTCQAFRFLTIRRWRRFWWRKDFRRSHHAWTMQTDAAITSGPGMKKEKIRKITEPRRAESNSCWQNNLQCIFLRSFSAPTFSSAIV